jgi:hypothetical protein
MSEDNCSACKGLGWVQIIGIRKHKCEQCENSVQDLANRAISCQHWRWIEGMLSNEGRVTYISDGRVMALGSGPYEHDIGISALPDLDDPATLGCLLALIRGVFKDPDSCCLLEFNGSWQVFAHDSKISDCKTEIEALVSALESAQ